MKHIKTLSAILTACLLLTVVSCTSSDTPADAQAESETVTETKADTKWAPETVTETEADTKTAPETESETEPYVVYDFESINAHSYEPYNELRVGPYIEASSLNIRDTYGFNTLLLAPIIYAKSNVEFAIRTITESESMEFNRKDFDITWRIAEPELLEVMSVNPDLFLMVGYVETVPSIYRAGMAVRTLAPGVAHLYITVTHRETGGYFTLQQIIVIEES